MGFTVDLPEAPCCSLDLCCLPINVVVGDVGMHSYSALQVTTFTACLCPVTLIFKVLLVSPMFAGNLVAVLTGDLVYNFLLLFGDLLLHS